MDVLQVNLILGQNDSNLQPWPKIMGQLTTFIGNSFSDPPSPLQCCFAAVFTSSLQAPSCYQHCKGEGEVSGNENESLNNVMVTAYQCVK